MGPLSVRTAADFSPNNRGFAMASPFPDHEKDVAGDGKPLLAQVIDNNPTPSYLSRDLG